MAMRWRGLALILFFVATWLGCDSAQPSTPPDEAMGATAGTGTAALGGRSGAGGTSGMGSVGGITLGGSGGGAGTSGVPQAWACGYSTYGDGKCDCGCGAPDKDCTSAELGRCEVCNTAGSCNLAACPGRINPDDVTKCVAPPAGWTCTPALYGDGRSCDCGCGIQDQDCPSTDPNSCDNCLAMGSCAISACPSTLAADDNTRCEIPARWTCEDARYGDGTCHCGCGVVDVDCPDAMLGSCEECDRSSCSPFACEVEADDNAHCPEPPLTWNCSPRLYWDGSRCDCGCGAIDPDCDALDAEACDVCDAPGSCSAQACPSFIDPEFNGHCAQPLSPVEWTCNSSAYADGIACDCGCGIPDPDCRDSQLSTCVRCLSCGGMGVCAGLIDPEDTTQCASPMAGWTCSEEHYRDYICDCGCGIPDVYCQGIELRYVCGNYPVEGCSGGNRNHIDPNHNALCVVSVPDEWTCERSYFEDGLCDCGCGTLDPDCVLDEVTACETCDSEGSCSTEACPGTIVPDDTAHCSE